MHVFSIRVTNIVFPDQMALYAEASLSGPTVFCKKDRSGFSRTRVKIQRRLDISCESSANIWQHLISFAKWPPNELDC